MQKHNLTIDTATTPAAQEAVFRDLLVNPPADERPVLCAITPLLAKTIIGDVTLTPPQSNRSPTQAKIKQYAEDMRQNRWALVGDTLKFSHKLEDGQNRLRACVASQKVLRTHIMFGVNEADFYRMDQGKPRNKVDVFQMEKVPYYNTAAAACRWVRIQTDKKSRGAFYSPGDLLEYYRKELKGTAFDACVRQAHLAKNVSKITPGHFAGLAYLAVVNGAKASKVLTFIKDTGELTARPYCPAVICRISLERIAASRKNRLHEDIRTEVIKECLDAHLAGQRVMLAELENKYK